MRCFVGYRLPPEAKEALAAVQAEFPREKMTLVKPPDIHITLKFFGELSDEKAHLVQKLVKNFFFHPFEAHLGKIGFFSHVIYVAIEPEERFFSLYTTLQTLLQEAGFEEEGRFRCHATLARIKKRIPLSAHMQNIPIPSISFTVTELSFVHSTLTKEGPIYREICPIFSTQEKRCIE